MYSQKNWSSYTDTIAQTTFRYRSNFVCVTMSNVLIHKPMSHVPRDASELCVCVCVCVCVCE